MPIGRFARYSSMRVFLDFEASSLAKTSYPIEVGWVFENGETDAFLIRPAPDWTDWDETAEHVHGISRERLQLEGIAHQDACDRLVRSLSTHTLFASAPSWDGHWLSMLLRAGGQPRHLLRLRDTEEVFVEAVRDGLGASAGPDRIIEIVSLARSVVENGPVAHRALQDAQREMRIWREVQRIVASRFVD